MDRGGATSLRPRRPSLLVVVALSALAALGGRALVLPGANGGRGAAASEGQRAAAASAGCVDAHGDVRGEDGGLGLQRRGLLRGPLALAAAELLAPPLGASLLLPEAAEAEEENTVLYGWPNASDTEVLAGRLAPMERKAVLAKYKNLTRLQRRVAFQQGKLVEGYKDVVREQPFSGQNENGYAFDNDEEGVYYSVVSGLPLFSSKTKFNSGTGFAAFWTPINSSNILERNFPKDKATIVVYQRIEVLDRASMTHIGFRFRDGPKPTGWRYSINSCAMRFVPGPAPEGDYTQAPLRPAGLYGIFESNKNDGGKDEGDRSSGIWK